MVLIYCPEPVTNYKFTPRNVPEERKSVYNAFHVNAVGSPISREVNLLTWNCVLMISDNCIPGWGTTIGDFVDKVMTLQVS
jgi:hypothetical protein